jgi:hypothetical protein
MARSPLRAAISAGGIFKWQAENCRLPKPARTIKGIPGRSRQVHRQGADD